MNLQLKQNKLYYKDVEVTKHFNIKEININEEMETLAVCEIKIDYDILELKSDLVLMLKGMKESELIDFIDEANNLLKDM